MLSFTNLLNSYVIKTFKYVDSEYYVYLYNSFMSRATINLNSKI